MALKPTIYKATISISDLNRNYYDSLNLTIAQHPSETKERMMVRVLAFCLNASPELSFTKGLSATEEPDIIARSLDDSLEKWIDVGEPSVERIKKASRLARTVNVYSFNSKSSVWWQQNQAKFEELSVNVYQVDWQRVQILASRIERTMALNVTISEESAYFSLGEDSFELTWTVLQNKNR